MTFFSTLRFATLVGFLLLPVPERLAACAFHATLPEATLSQQIAGAIEVIAARPSPEDPFRFEVTEVLKGVISASRPPHLVDSATRARLARNPEEAVLFVREADGSWTRLLVLDAATRPLVDWMLARAGAWATSAGADERRDSFSELLRHPDDLLQKLSLRELDALPYGVLRGGTYPIPVADLLRSLADIQDVPYAPIRILLLGIDGSYEARDEIGRRLASMAAGGGSTNLGAWLTALMESSGPDGIVALERLFLGASGGLTGAQLTEIVRALSVQSAEGDPTLRKSIDSTLRRLVSLRPDAAPLIAQAFGGAEDYSQVPLIREFVAARAFSSIGELMAATAYIARARTEE